MVQQDSAYRWLLTKQLKINHDKTDNIPLSNTLQDKSNMATERMMSASHDLLKGLLEYIEEQATVVDPKGFRLSAVTGFIRRNTELTNLPGVEFDQRIEGDHLWLRLSRLNAEPPPTVPELYKSLFKKSDDPFGAEPIIEERIFVAWIAQEESKPKPQQTPIIDSTQRREELRKKAVAAFQEYVSRWKVWAEGERPRRKSIALYGDLFALKHQIETEQTAKPQELVWGIGVALWQIPYEESALNFEYPLLTQVVEIAIDEKSMALEIRPRATDTRVEMDAFAACSVLGAPAVEHAIKEQLQRYNDRVVSPFDASSYADLLKLAASKLDSNGSYQEVLTTGEPIPPSSTALIVTDAWVLLSRPRATHYLTDDLKRLKATLESGCDIPVGPAALVSKPSDQSVEFEAIRFRGISSRGSGQGTAEELYFPLPYNDEQVTIIQRLERAAGVAVQGPPGTGKTHTIANVICHYLATGRRVLVTSRGEPALEVLQSKIPEEVRALTVALMTSDREGVRQFQASIAAIQHQVSQLNSEETRQAITRLEGEIDRAHHELAAIDARIDEIALKQLSQVEIDGMRMQAQMLAQLVIAGSQQYSWFDDELTLSSEHVPPLSEEDSGKLREARRNVGEDIVYLEAHCPSVDALPPMTVIAELHEVLSRMRTIDADVARGDLLQLRANTNEVLLAARELLEQIEEAKTLAEELEFSAGDWALTLRSKCRHPSFLSERQALESLFVDIDLLVHARIEFLMRPVEFPDAGLSTLKTREAVARAVETGKPFGVIAFGLNEAKEHIAIIKVSGLSPTSKEDWAHVHKYIELHEQIVSFASRWNTFADNLSIPRIESSISALRQIEMIATIAKKAHRLATVFDTTLPTKAETVFCSISANALRGGSTEFDAIKKQLLRHLDKVELSKAATQLNLLQEKLAGTTGPVSIALHHFVEHQLGNPAFASDRVIARYVELMAELRRLASLTSELLCIKDFANRLEQAGALKLASRIRSQAVAMSGEDTVFPVTWKKAWTWSRIRTHLNALEAQSELRELSDKRKEFEDALARLYKDLIAKAAWLATKQHATPKVLQALAGYATAIRRIGRGTGTNAIRYRRDARDAMLDAAGAIPCWIMSHARISESMPAEIGAFDLVIVDEASQSDLWALPAILRGKKILVVGDDKQVSPDAGFKSSSRIEELKVRFLSEQPHGREMTPEKSLYDLAARVFAAEQVMLREHFRCVPPIIAYSNRVFYKGGIQPLRIPKESERMEPPLVDIYIPEGFRDRHDTNDYEAQAIAEEISAILNNAAFSNRTIGVVSLLGMEQAKHIDLKVRQRCDAAELLNRKFECGDARTFQGSERDIIFLSMVVDSNNCRALAGNMYEQRFNVAASRARDRMYLVRSVKASDLSDADLRLTLLEHFNKPLVTDHEETDVLVNRCESGFEREVFSRLVALGYRVIPQVKTGAYRIDMVIEGANDNRLAIELDGDDYHGPDRWQHDMNRQRVLERAGWIFWRCFASTWSLRKEDILQELLERLTKMNIEPLGAIERVPSFVEQRIWRVPLSSVSEVEFEL